MELVDRQVEEYSVNYILGNIYEQVDDNGWGTGIFQEIMDFYSNPEVCIPKEEYDMVEVNGINKLVITIKLWDSQVQ